MVNRKERRFRIALVDDQKLVREALGAFLEDGGGATVVWSIPHNDGVTRDLESDRVDAIIVGFESQLHDPLETVHRLARQYPRVPLVALVNSTQAARVHGALAAGCNAVLCDSVTLDEIDAALAALASGQSYVQAELGSELVRRAVNDRFGNDGFDGLDRKNFFRPQTER